MSCLGYGFHDIEGDDACIDCSDQFDKEMREHKMAWVSKCYQNENWLDAIMQPTEMVGAEVRPTEREHKPHQGERDEGKLRARHVYELTLTSIKDDPYELRTTLGKIVKSKMYKVKYWKAAIELTAAGIPHIHAILCMDCKYVDRVKIKKWTPYRYSFSPVRDLDNYLNYVIKEEHNNIVIDYCKKKGIPQIWESGEENLIL